MKGDDLGVVTNHFYDIDIRVRRGGVAVECTVPTHCFGIGREILSLEDQLSPAVENAHGLYVVDARAPWIEIIIDTVAIGEKVLGRK